jgi:hypothetical protein
MAEAHAILGKALGFDEFDEPDDDDNDEVKRRKRASKTGCRSARTNQRSKGFYPVSNGATAEEAVDRAIERYNRKHTPWLTTAPVDSINELRSARKLGESSQSTTCLLLPRCLFTSLQEFPNVSKKASPAKTSGTGRACCHS